MDHMKEAFLARMEAYLKEEFPAFLASLDCEMYRGVRYNLLKLTKEQFMELFPYDIKQTPFCEEAFYIDADIQKLGTHPLHVSGGIYMQEPSATSAVTVLDVQSDDWVLDLCAAPGGKSSQIAAKLNHSGLLVANEIDFKRAKILLSNMERLGFGEVIITNNRADQLCHHCTGWFDKILVDAPCSGEGMMKKHDEAMHGWSVANVQACANRQFEILNTAFDAFQALALDAPFGLRHSAFPGHMVHVRKRLFALRPIHSDKETAFFPFPLFAGQNTLYMPLCQKCCMLCFC